MEYKVCNIGLIFVIFYVVISFLQVQITFQKRRIFNLRTFIQNSLSLTEGDRHLLVMCIFLNIVISCRFLGGYLCQSARVSDPGPL